MDKLEKLLEIGTEAEKTELKVMHNAKVANLKSYNESKSSADLRNYEAASEKLDRLTQQFWVKYFNEEKSFANIMEVVKTLQEQGYDVKKSKVYKDSKNGLLRVEPSGRINELSVRAYAAGLDKKKSMSYVDSEDLQRRKTEAETKKNEIQAKSAQFDLDIKMGKYIPRHEFDMEMAARVAVLESSIKNFFQTKAGDLIDCVAGDRGRSNDLIDMFNSTFDVFINAMADCERFQVIFNEQGIMNSEQFEEAGNE